MNTSSFISNFNQYSHEKIQKIGIALWLRNNTQLNTNQISQISGLHLFESILIYKNACNFSFNHINPVYMNMISEEQIRNMEQSPNKNPNFMQFVSKRYIPKPLRVYIPGAVKWMKSHYPQINDTIIAKYMGITKKKVLSIIESDQEEISPILVQLIDDRILQNMLQEN